MKRKERQTHKKNWAKIDIEKTYGIVKKWFMTKEKPKKITKAHKNTKNKSSKFEVLSPEDILCSSHPLPGTEDKRKRRVIKPKKDIYLHKINIEEFKWEQMCCYI